MLKTVVGKIRNNHQFKAKSSKLCPLNDISSIGTHQNIVAKMLKIMLIVPKLVWRLPVLLMILVPQ